MTLYKPFATLEVKKTSKKSSNITIFQCLKIPYFMAESNFLLKSIKYRNFFCSIKWIHIVLNIFIKTLIINCELNKVEKKAQVTSSLKDIFHLD